MRLALCWARPSGPCLLHEVGVVLARGGRGRSRTYFFRENCVIPQTTGGRPQWSAGKVRSRGESQFPMREPDLCVVGTVARRPAVPAYLVGVRPRVR